MAENNMSNQTDDEISLKDLILKIKEIWSYLWSKWKIILPVGILGGLLGLAYSIYKEPTYVAELSFSVIEKGGGGGGLAALAGQFGLGGGGSSDGMFSGANIPELLESRAMVERTLLAEVKPEGKPCRLIEYYLTLNPPKDEKDALTVGFPLSQERSTFSREQDSTLNVFRQQITTKKLEIAKPKKDISIITLSFKNEHERFAQLFTETLMREVSEFYVQTKTHSTRSNLTSMQRSADSLKAEYEKALTSRAILADQNMNLTKQVMGVSQQKYQTQIQLTGTAYGELTKNIEILKLDLAREMPLVQIIDRPIFPLQKERLGKAKGMIIGGFLAGFLIVSYLLGSYFFRQIMQDEQ